MSLLRPPVEVVNHTRYPDAEVRRIVERSMRGDKARPPKVLVLGRERRNDDRLGFTPFDRSQPIRLWVEPEQRYPQPGAHDWREELAKSAAHEDFHFQHNHEPCPNDVCESKAERFATERYRRMRGRLRVKQR